MQQAFICVWHLRTDPEWLSMQPSSRTVLLTPRLAFYLKGCVAGSNSIYLVFPAYRHHAFSLHLRCLVQEVGQKVAMHAVAMKPRYLSPDTVPIEALEGIPSTISPHAMYQAHHELESGFSLIVICVIIIIIIIANISSSTCLPVGIYDSIMCPRLPRLVTASDQ